MSEERTQDIPDNRSFEERVFARFDALDSRLGTMEARLDTMDERLRVLEQKSYDTKPIWERALAEILELRESVANIERKFDVLTRDMMQLRADQSRIENRIDKVEPKLNP